MGKILYRFRWAIGAAVIILAVVFGISGSSIGMWAEYLPGCADNGVLFGTPRSIRADEWAVSTVASFSQTYKGTFGYFEDALRGTDTDMVLASNAPVLEPVALTRVFSMGYVLFGINGGLAFFWVSRLVVLFLVTFQFFLLLTEDKKGWSFSGALLVTFSGAIQWWFHTSALLECIVYGELAVLVLHRYFHVQETWKRLAYALALGVLGYAYAMALYPAWQIPLVYVFLAVLVWQITELKQEGVLHLKQRDVLSILLAGAVCAAGVAYFLVRSADGLAAVNGTEYPGTRFENGGGMGLEFFQYANSIFYPLFQTGLEGNVCEQALFFDLFPLGMLMALWQLAKNRKKDMLQIGLLAVNLFFMLFCLVGFPDVLARYTFMSNCPPVRVLVIFSYAGILLLIRGLSRMEPMRSERQVAQRSRKASAVFVTWTWRRDGWLPAGLFALCVTVAAHTAQSAYMTRWMAVVEFLVLICMVRLICGRQEKKFAAFCAILSVFTGLLVNPVQKGADFIYESPLIRAIVRTNTQEGVWMVEGLSYPYNNIPLLVGASTIDSTSYYPDLERWRRLDPSGEQEFVYNRFAHIRMDLVEEGVSWFGQGEADDRLSVNLDINDLEKMDVDYILTRNDLTHFNREGLTFTLLHQVGEYRIYHVDVN